MKTAGDILSALFDERMMKKAQGYSRLFDSWTDITQKNGIASAADHSRIKELDKGILLIEMDHPGWKQIIQTKQSKLLNDFRRRFPDMNISGISLMLGRGEPPPPAEEKETEIREEPAAVQAAPGYDAIKDEKFKETLKKLGESIAARETGRLHCENNTN